MNYTLNEKYKLIKQDIIKYTTKNPVQIVCEMMKKDFINIHGPEHHFLVGAVFLVAYNNAVGKLILTKALTPLRNVL